VPFPDATTELLTAARWARALLESGRPGSIGVVVPDLAARRKAVERIFRSVLEPAFMLPGRPPSAIVNLSAGEPLTAVPLTASALAILGLRPDGNDWKDISALLRNSYLGGAATESSRRGLLDAELRSEGVATLRLSHVRERCLEAGCQVLERSLKDWLRVFEQAPARQTAAGWSRTFSSLLEAAGWPGESSLSSSEYQALKSWTELLSEFAGSGVTLGETGAGQAVSMLRRMAEERIFQPETEDAPVQILGALETSGLRFDHLWVTGLHDEAWPATAKPNPFLPIRLQRAAGIPHSSPERELAFARSVTQRLLALGLNLTSGSCAPPKHQENRLWPKPARRAPMRQRLGRARLTRRAAAAGVTGAATTGDQPLTEPATIPRTKNRCRARNTISGSAIAMDSSAAATGALARRSRTTSGLMASRPRPGTPGP
jgi:probable DNA repair protein